jgi:hypothetical protein
VVPITAPQRRVAQVGEAARVLDRASGQGDDGLLGLEIDLTEADHLRPRLGHRDLLDGEIEVLGARRDRLLEGIAHPDHVFGRKAHLGGQRVDKTVLEAFPAGGVVVQHPRRIDRIARPDGQLAGRDEARVLRRAFLREGGRPDCRHEERAQRGCRRGQQEPANEEWHGVDLPSRTDRHSVRAAYGATVFRASVFRQDLLDPGLRRHRTAARFVGSSPRRRASLAAGPFGALFSKSVPLTEAQARARMAPLTWNGPAA